MSTDEMTAPPAADAPGPADDIAMRLVEGAAAMFDLMSISLGDRLGLYRCLAERGPLTAPEVADAAGVAERYTREWLEQQAVTGLLEVVTAADEPTQRRYGIAPGAAAVLATPGDPNYLAPLARQLVAAAAAQPAVARACRDGGGVPWAAFGADMRESEAELNRPSFQHLLASDWIPALPDVQSRLSTAPPARIADVGCGGGWSAIALAEGFPTALVDAYDVDPASVDLARHNIAEAGLAGRIRVHEADIGQVGATGYDLVTAFECVHDLPHPVEALDAMRRMAEPAGAVLIGDMRVADEFTAPGDLVERLMYGFSLAVCLPDSLSAEGSAATGTVMRESTLRAYAEQAHFAAVDTLPVEHDLWRFYRLHPRRAVGAA